MTKTTLPGAVFQGIEEYQSHLDKELGEGASSWGGLRYQNPAPPTVFWTKNRWLEPFALDFDSISQAAKALRAIQRNWAAVPVASFRRMELIKDQLPPLALKPKAFPWTPPDAPMGAWSLLDDHRLVASARCDSPFPAGDIEFVEDKEGPPSRAYLKLYEALARSGRFPAPGEHCLDAGAAPGGWTWALSRLGARVTAVDRSPLESRIAAMANVEYLKHDAFTLKPEDIGPVDWVFSDVICYPPRLLEWARGWLASGLCTKFICTIKMQGEPDWATSAAFLAIPGSRVVHLNYNKHELTWILA